MPITAVHLALAFDERYITPLYVLLTSLFLNNRGDELNIHLIASGLVQEDQNKIIDFIQSRGGNVIFYDVSERGVDQFILPDHEGNYLSAAIYYRLFFPFLVQKVKKLLYIDVDTLIVGNLKELFEVDMHGQPVAAVTDTDMPVRSDLGIYSMEDYFNSGVLLIDIAKWKEQQITEQTLQIIQEQPDRIKRYPDQDALNMVLKDNWYKLPVSYNLMRLYVPNEVPKRRFADFLQGKKIIHYNGKKPWFSNCEHRLRHIYQQYARLSPIVGADKITKVPLPKAKRELLFRSRIVEFYFDHPELVAVWRRVKALIGKH